MIISDKSHLYFTHNDSYPVIGYLLRGHERRAYLLETMIINSSVIASTVRGVDVSTSQGPGCLFPITCCLSRKEGRLGPDEARADDASGVGMGRLMKVKLLPAPHPWAPWAQDSPCGVTLFPCAEDGLPAGSGHLREPSHLRSLDGRMGRKLCHQHVEDCPCVQCQSLLCNGWEQQPKMEGT